MGDIMIAKRVIAIALCAGGLAACGENYAGFCEDVATQYDTGMYDKFEITEVIDYTAQDNPRPEVYVRFTGMRETGFEEKRNVLCEFDDTASGLKVTNIVVDGRKLTPEMVAQYTRTLGAN